jgi:putative Mg2+ transporter-C (MgtC) family protein
MRAAGRGASQARGPLYPAATPANSAAHKAPVPGQSAACKEGSMSMILTAGAVSPAANTLGGEGWRQAGELGLALLLSAAIGLEREIRQKDAGLRTHTLVGVGAALFMLISKYGFTDVLEARLAVLDPSRVAAQIVSGVGFLGAGLIFVSRGSVRGLTTAASIWVVAAIGAAAGAGLVVLAALATGLYFVVALAFPAITHRLPLPAATVSALRVRYPDGRGLLRDVLREAAERGFAIDDVSTEPAGRRPGAGAGPTSNGEPAMVEVTLHVHGKHPVGELAAALSDLDYVDAVLASNVNAIDE